MRSGFTTIWVRRGDQRRICRQHRRGRGSCGKAASSAGGAGPTRRLRHDSPPPESVHHAGRRFRVPTARSMCWCATAPDDVTPSWGPRTSGRGARRCADRSAAISIRRLSLGSAETRIRDCEASSRGAGRKVLSRFPQLLHRAPSDGFNALIDCGKIDSCSPTSRIQAWRRGAFRSAVAHLANKVETLVVTRANAARAQSRRCASPPSPTVCRVVDTNVGRLFAAGVLVGWAGTPPRGSSERDTAPRANEVICLRAAEKPI